MSGRVCAALQYSDQMFCRVCDKGWDMNDPSPPPCPRETGQQIPRDETGAYPEGSTMRVTFDEAKTWPAGQLVTSVHYETDPKTGKRRVIIGFG